MTFTVTVEWWHVVVGIVGGWLVLAVGYNLLMMRLFLGPGALRGLFPRWRRWTDEDSSG